uniref:Cadherin 18 n=1 Tax=Cyprinus carpio carpio TaxID=630221 RepID=A0A9J7Y9E4_CYPCA
MRAASSPACLSPLLLCLCVLQRSFGTPSPPSPTFIHNQTKLPDGDKDSHHRPKRGWIWNQFFVLEEHFGPDAQYVGKGTSITPSAGRVNAFYPSPHPHLKHFIPPSEFSSGCQELWEHSRKKKAA